MVLILLSFISSYNRPLTGVDNPVPVLLNHGEVLMQIREEPIGKLRGKIAVGIWNSIFLGVSYGDSNLVGYGDMKWDSRPSLDIRMRLFGTGTIESVVGYNNERLDKYEEKDIFAAIGYQLNFGNPNLLISGGSNFNHVESGFDFFGNAILNFSGSHTFHVEYIFGANDEDDERNRINLGYRLQSGSMGVQFDVKDIFSDRIGRQIQIFYRENF